MPTQLIEAQTDIAASPEQVWSIVSDLTRMGEWSPQCRKTLVFGGDVKLGTRTVNINRQGFKVWPTQGKVVRFTPGKEIAVRIVENHTVWSFQITPNADGVTLTERRELPDGTTTPLSRFLVKVALGGNEGFEKNLRRGIAETLAKIKAAAES